MPNTTDTHTQNHTLTSEPSSVPELIIALDYGVKKMGVAMGNTLSGDARPFTILSMDNGQPNWQELIELIEEWQAKQVVIGLPLNMDGTSSPIAKRATKFARRLAHKMMEQKNPVKIYMHDERLSSREARDIAHKNTEKNGWKSHDHAPIDDISACILLNSYLEDMSYATDLTAYVIH